MRRVTSDSASSILMVCWCGGWRAGSIFGDNSVKSRGCGVILVGDGIFCDVLLLAG